MPKGNPAGYLPKKPKRNPRDVAMKKIVARRRRKGY